MKTLDISLQDLQKFYMHYHGFYDIFELPFEESYKEFFARIPSIQYDPLNMIGKNADLVLFSRIKNYRKEMLFQKLYEEKDLLDGWDKQMGIYESKYFGHYHFMREKHVKQLDNSFKRFNFKVDEYLSTVINTLKEQGPLPSSKINLPKFQITKTKATNISGLACDYLFHKGILGVHKKTNVIKHYDIIENLIPITENPFQTEEEFLIWYTKRRIGNLGAVWNKNGSAWLGHLISKKDKRDKAIDYLFKTEQIIKLNVENVRYPFYIRKEDERFLNNKQFQKRAIFIAPLDSFIWDRELIRQIFNFDYGWEVYVPEAKRKFGYYVIPVMIGNRFVGRFEPNVGRKNLPLSIKNWWWEPDFHPTSEDITLILNEFKRLSYFLESSEVDIEGIKSLLIKS